MTLPARRATALVLSSLAAAVVGAGAVAVPADAAPSQGDLRPVISRYNASVDACKVLRDGGAKVQVYVQLDNTRNRPSQARTGGLSIARDGVDTGKNVQLPVTRGGTRSRIKSITFATGGHLTVGAGIGAGQMGDGASFAFKRVPFC